MAQETKDSEERRNEFVEAAEKLFRENGIMETTVNSIVREMDVAKGLFYYYFRSKDDVIEAISEKYSEVFRQMMETSMDSTQEYHERLEQFVENTVTSYRQLMQKLQTDGDVDLTQLSIRSLEEAKYSVSEGLRMILEEGCEEGILTLQNIQYYADLLTAGIEELIRKNEAADEEIREIVLDLIERAGKDA